MVSGSAAVAAAPAASNATGDRLQGNSQKRDVRRSNIVAAKAIAQVVRTSLGPKGMDKMIIAGDGQVVISNDGATIMDKMEVVHPAAKMVCILL
jgi:T-complex protein 1 subunit delta